jgi:hypothetical protein
MQQWLVENIFMLKKGTPEADQTSGGATYLTSNLTKPIVSPLSLHIRT